MIFSVKIPNFGEIVTKSVVTKIYKKAGDHITPDDIIIDVETEKATLEIRSHYAGFITEIFVKEDEEVIINQDVFQIATDDTEIKNEIIESVDRVEMPKLRKIMSARLKHIQNTAAIVTTFNEVDMSNIIAKRTKYKQNGKKIGLMPFFIKAVTSILPNFPGVNAQIEDDYILYKKYYNIGFAVDIEDGLFISVVENADKMNIEKIANEMEDLIFKAKNSDLNIKDVKNGTFTITNGGVYGSLFSTPIINPPQSGILGVNSVIDRPIALNGQVVIRPMMYISLSYDHRIIDGKEAIGFLNELKIFLQNYDA